MSYTQAQDEILAELRAHAPGVEVFEGIRSDEALAKLEPGTNQMAPFITVDFGALVTSHRKVQGIIGAAYNTHEGNIIVHAVANDMDTARKTIGRVRDVLLGFQPTNCGELTPEMYGGNGQNSIMVNPSRYAQVQPFVFYTNSDKDA